MAIEDILQIHDVQGDDTQKDQNINQAEFLRFLKGQGLSTQEVMGRVVDMFIKAPSKFTAEFGLESAEAIREFLGLVTQEKMERDQGKVFRENSAEIMGQNIDYTPDQSAIGTLQTDQSENTGNLGEFFQKYKDRMAGQVGPDGLLRAVKEGTGLQESLQDQIGPGGFLSGVKKEDELQESLQDRLNTQSLLKRIQLQDQLMDQQMDTEWITKKDKEWITKKDKEEKNFLVDIMKDIIQGGMETGSGIINAIMEEAKELYRQHTEQSPDYNPEFYEKEILNETTEDYYPPGP